MVAADGAVPLNTAARMSDSIIKAQQEEFESIQEELLSIRGAAVAEKRPLSDEENEKAQELLTRAHSIQSSLKKLLAEQKSLSETQALFGELAQTATTSPAVHTRAEAPKDASEYFLPAGIEKYWRLSIVRRPASTNLMMSP